MKLEIDDEYLEWVDSFSKGTAESAETPEERETFLTAYVNDVLADHRKSWDELGGEEDDNTPT